MNVSAFKLRSITDNNELQQGVGSRIRKFPVQTPREPISLRESRWPSDRISKQNEWLTSADKVCVVASVPKLALVQLKELLKNP